MSEETTFVVQDNLTTQQHVFAPLSLVAYAENY